MGSLTKTLKIQTVRSFGPSPSTKWSLFNWTLSGVGPGNGTWGMKSAACQGTSPIQKNIFRTLTHSSMSIGISCPATSIYKTLNKVHNHAITVSYLNSDKELTDGRGFYYVFPGPVTNIENEEVPQYVSGSLGTTTYTSATASITTWS